MTAHGYVLNDQAIYLKDKSCESKSKAPFMCCIAELSRMIMKEWWYIRLLSFCQLASWRLVDIDADHSKPSSKETKSRVLSSIYRSSNSKFVLALAKHQRQVSSREEVICILGLYSVLNSECAILQLDLYKFQNERSIREPFRTPERKYAHRNLLTITAIIRRTKTVIIATVIIRFVAILHHIISLIFYSYCFRY